MSCNLHLRKRMLMSLVNKVLSLCVVEFPRLTFVSATCALRRDASTFEFVLESPVKVVMPQTLISHSKRYDCFARMISNSCAALVVMTE